MDRAFSAAEETFHAQLRGSYPSSSRGLVFVNVWASDARRDLALGSNLLGSLLGGLASVLSMAIGFRALTFLTLAVYVVAGLSMRGVSAATPRRPIRAARHG